MTIRNILTVAGLTCLCLIVGAATILASPASRWTGDDSRPEFINPASGRPASVNAALSFDGAAVDFDAAMAAGADYLQGMQADITEDNAGNGTDGVNETPDDPDDGGWDWRVTSPPAPFSHTTSASSPNLYGATAGGLLAAYLETGDAGYYTAMTDAADTMANNPNVRSAADLVYLMNYNDLPAVVGTQYADSARAKYDARIATYGTAWDFAEYIRDIRGVSHGYPNGIIAWDIGAWARVAAMLEVRYPGNSYGVDAVAIAEVLYQDSYMDNPGYFDIVDDAGWDPTYADVNFYWYNLGITGLIDAFDAAGTHTAEIAGLVTLLLDGQAAHGGVSYCYGGNAGDDDWQSTAYAMLTLARLDQATYQSEINDMGFFLGATQHSSGGWVYSSSGNHYPEIGGECTAGLYYTTNATTYDLADAIVDAAFTWQGDVDAYNDANGTSFVFGYNAFGTIQEAIDAVDGSTVMIGPGTYVENLLIDKYVELIGAGSGSDPLTNTIITQTAAGAGDTRIGVVQVAASGTTGSPILLQDLRLEPDGIAGVSVGRFTEGTGQLVEYLKMDNVHVIGTNVNPSTEQERGLYVDLTSTLRYLDIDDCAFDNLTYGWYFQKEVSADASNVQFVAVDNTTFNHNNHKGIYAEKLSDATFTGCTADDNGFDSSVLPSYFAPWSAGIDINLKAGTYANIAFFDCIITNNATDESREGVGLTVKARDDGATYGAFPAAVDNVDVIGCTITGNERGLRFGEPGRDNATPTNITVENCTLLGNVQQYSGSDGSAYGDLINMLVAGQVVDASPNYWGDNDATDQIYGEVTWGPWWMDAAMTILGYPPVHNVTQDTYFWTIQAAIDAANPLDLIQVAAGTMVPTAQIVIDKDITLQGAGSTLTTIEPGFNTTVGYYLVSDALIYVDYGVTAVIEDFLIDGTGFTVRHAIQSRGADLTVRDCEIRDIYANTYAGRGIVFLTGTGLVENCQMSNIQRIGIHIRGGIEPTAPDVDVYALTYVGKGVGDWLDYGVEFGGGGTGTVQNSIITDCLGVASVDGSTSAAILATDYYGTGTVATISGCSLNSNTTGIYAGYTAGDGTVLVAYDNDLTGNDLGIMAVTATPVDAAPNWWGDIDPTDDVDGDVIVYPCYTDGSMTTLFAPVINVTQSTYFETILPAVAAAVAGDVLHLAERTFTEGPQIVIDKDLTMEGQGAGAIILPTVSTGSSGDARGWFLVTAGTLFNLSNVTLDGAGFDVYQCVRSHGGGVYSDVIFSNMVFPGYGGVGLAVFGNDNVTIDGCTFTNMGRIGALLFGPGLTDSYFINNTYIGKGDGDWLDYAADISAGAVVTVDNCDITNCTGVASSDGSTSAGLLVTTYYGAGTTADVSNCTITGCTTAIAIGYDAADVSVVTAYHNSMFGNDWGITTTGAIPINAEENWWGTANGAEVSALTDGPIDFSPWCTDATHTDCTVTSGIAVVSTSSLMKCGDTEVLWIGFADGIVGVEAASFKLAFDHNYITPTGVIKAPPYDASGMFLSYVIDLAADSLSIDVGITEGAFDGPGNLVGVEFTAVGEVVSTDITFERSIVRDGDNQDMYHETSDASVAIDCTLPEAPVDFTVLPGHERIKLSWTNPTGDPSFAGIEIRRNPWAVGAYPEYDDFAPALGYPADATQGDLAYLGTGEDHIDDHSALPRNIYYYTVFAFDAAGNYSPVTPVQQGRATDYWLGDVGGLGLADGNVYYGDLQVLSNTYGNTHGDPSFEPEFDIGPTATGGPRSTPLTDNIVNFEDLAIFAINFNVVGPLLKVIPIFDDESVDGPLAVSLYRPAKVAVGEEFTVHVSLQNNPGTIKALAYDLAYDPSELEMVRQESSEQLRNAGAPLFYNGRITEMGVEIDLALLGGTTTIGGSGELGQVTFRVLKEGADIRLENVDARDAENQKLTVEKVNDGAAPGSLPDSFSLLQNYPNPFNPTTTVAYNLPMTADVRLEVINILGQRVAILVDGSVEAGNHSVEWDAREQASGVYFYKLTAGDFVQTKKMLLLR